MSSALVKPMGQLLQTQPPNRPPMTSPIVKSAKRNLFDSCSEDVQIDAMIAVEHKRTLDYVMLRYNIDLKNIEEKCNQQKKISAATPASTQFYISVGSSSGSSSEKTNTHFVERKCATSPYARLQGVKHAYRVRKSSNGNSNVPKRINNQNKNNNNNNNNVNNINNNKTKVNSHNSQMGAKEEVQPQQQQQQNNNNNINNGNI